MSATVTGLMDRLHWVVEPAKAHEVQEYKADIIFFIKAKFRNTMKEWLLQEAA